MIITAAPNGFFFLLLNLFNDHSVRNKIPKSISMSGTGTSWNVMNNVSIHLLAHYFLFITLFAPTTNAEKRNDFYIVFLIGYRLEFIRCSRAMHVPHSPNEFTWFAWQGNWFDYNFSSHSNGIWLAAFESIPFHFGCRSASCFYTFYGIGIGFRSI